MVTRRALVTGCASVLVAAALSSGAAAKETLVFGSIFPAELFDSVYPALSEAFMKSHPDIEVTYQKGWDNDKILVSGTAGTGPDVILDGGTRSPSYLAAAMLPIETMLQQDGVSLDSFLPDTPRVVDGHVYALPSFVDPNFPLIYNKTLMAASGLDPNAPPTTIEQATQLFPKLTRSDASGAITQIAMTPWAMSNRWNTWPITFGAQLWAGDPHKGHWNLLDDHMVAAITWLQTLEQQYQPHLPPDDNWDWGVGSRMSQGTQVMTYNVTPSFSEYKTASGQEFGIAPPMSAAGGPAVPLWFGGFIVGVGAHTQHVKAAYMFVRWMATDPEASRILGEHGLVPGTRNAPGLRVLLEAQPDWRPFLDVLAQAQPAPYMPDALISHYGDAIDQFYSDTFQKNVLAKQSLEHLQQVLDAGAADAGILDQ